MSNFATGTRVRKRRGSSWQGVVVGHYSTALTPDGVCVESEREPGSVQVYPVAALELVPPRAGARLPETESALVITLFWLVLAAGLLFAARALWPSRAQRAYGYPHHTRNGHHR